MPVALKPQPISFPPPPRILARHRGIVFGEERFSGLRFEAEHLFEDHHQEASPDPSIQLSVNWDIFKRLEDAGSAVCVVARCNGFPIGYVTYVLFRHMHHDFLVADSDVFFLDKRFRSGWIGVRLFQIAEQLLREKGVDEIWNRIPMHVHPGRGGRDSGAIFRWLGYRPVETVYSKRII